jgi:hypothetical protein
VYISIATFHHLDFSGLAKSGNNWKRKLTENFNSLRQLLNNVNAEGILPVEEFIQRLTLHMSCFCIHRSIVWNYALCMTNTKLKIDVNFEPSIRDTVC